MFNIRKRVAVFTLLIICNFFIAPIIEVSAEESNINYLSKISEEENIIENNLLSLKNDTYYENDSYKYAIDKINRDFSNLKVDYNSYKNSALNNISIEDVLIDNNISLDNINLDNYAYLNLNNLKDITYYDEEKEENVTVLTKDTLESYVTKYYFNDYYNRYEEFSNNYLTNISNYQSFYNNVKNNYDNSITKINKIKEEINTFIENQKNLGNNPVTVYQNKSINYYLSDLYYDLDKSFKASLDNELENNFNDINTKAINLKTNILSINSNDTDELIEKINNLKEEYDNKYNALKDKLKENLVDLENKNYENIKNLDSIKIKEIIDFLENSYASDINYNSLLNEIDTYLNRMPSEEENFTLPLKELEDSYNNLSNENIYEIYKNIVENSNLENEDIVDVLLEYKNLVSSSDEYTKLINAKEKFYTLKLKDDKNYQIKIIGDTLVIINGNNISLNDFKNNIDYNAQFSLTGSKIIDKNSSLLLYDKNNKLLKTLKIVIKNDINGDGIIDDLDVSLLKDKVLKNDSKLETVICDTNSDGKVDIKDVFDLYNYVNKIDSLKTTKSAKFKVDVKEEKDNITYNVYLKSNGTIYGLYFDILTSNNLINPKVKLGKGVNYQTNDNSLKVIGLGKYKNDDLIISITYNKKSESDIKFQIQNGIIKLSDTVYLDNINYQSTIKNKTENNINSIKDVKPVFLTNYNYNPLKTENEVQNAKDIIYLEDYEGGNVIKTKTEEKSKDNINIPWKNVIKILVIVLLGALIIYFLNKDTEVVFENDEEKNSK